MENIELKRGLKLKNKYSSLGKEIRQKIMRGEYYERLPGLRNLAEEYDANVKTIRKSLKPLINEGILSLKHGSGIFITGESHCCIGIVGNPAESTFLEEGGYYSSMFKNMFPEIQRRGDFFSYQQKRMGLPYEGLFKNNSTVDALLIFAPFTKHKRDLLKLTRKLPCIIIGTTYSEKEINCISSDNLEDSKNGVEYLIKHGHKRIAFICTPLNSTTPVLRLQGYKNALSENNIDFDETLVIMEDVENQTFGNKIKKIFASSNTPTAIFGASLVATEKTLKIIRERKNNLAVVVYDDFNNKLSRFRMPYAAIKQPLSEIGKLAIEKLYELIEEKIEPPVHIKLKSKLIFKKP